MLSFEKPLTQRFLNRKLITYRKNNEIKGFKKQIYFNNV